MTTYGNGSGREDLVEEAKAVGRDAEQLLRETSSTVGENVEQLKTDAQQKFNSARDTLMEKEKQFVNNARDAAKQTDQYVHSHPWQAIGLGAAVGVIIGILMNRR